MIFYNGSTGSLGHYFESTLAKNGFLGKALQSRLEDRQSLHKELTSLGSTIPAGTTVSLVQMAAKVSVPECEKDPESAYKTNVTDTLATVQDFVEWAELKNLKPCILYMSTGHVYSAKPWGERITEEDSVAPRSVYAQSKLLAENELKVLSKKHGFPLLIARLFGLIAPQQPSQYVLPGMIQRVRENRLKSIPGLNYARDYLDSRDVCHSLLKLCHTEWLTSETSFEIVNICSGKEVLIRQIIEQIIDVLRPEEKINLMKEMSESPGRTDDIPWIVGNPLKLIKIIGDYQKTSISQTICEAIQNANMSTL